MAAENIIAWVMIAASAPAISGGMGLLSARLGLPLWNFYRAWALGAGGATIIILAAGLWLQGLVSLASTVLALILWWLSRRRRRRAPRAYGLKSRARVAALVRWARRTAIPRPVRRPAPDPA